MNLRFGESIIIFLQWSWCIQWLAIKFLHFIHPQTKTISQYFLWFADSCAKYQNWEIYFLFFPKRFIQNLPPNRFISLFFNRPFFGFLCKSHLKTH